MADDPTHTRRKMTERDVMDMLLRGENVHELGAVEIVAGPPAASAAEPRALPAKPPASHEAPAPATASTPPAPHADASATKRPTEANPQPATASLEGHLLRGSRWTREPSSLLEGITSYGDMNPRPRDAAEIYVVDLHGRTRQELAQILLDSLSSARASGRRFVRFITGRGLHSAGGYPVLRSAVELWLAQSVQAGLLAACAREDHIAIFAPDYGSFMARLPSRRAASPTPQD